MSPLSPERWAQIDALFAEALDRPAAGRDAWLDAVCAHDPELRRAVAALLESANAAEAALGESVSGYAEPLLAELRTELECEERESLPMNGRVGPYRILREIGRGGMGTVYLAERADEQFRKLVALKLVKRGMDTDEVLNRFRYERQILASLEHPHVARLYDGGAADDGRPYLVMEYIDGEPVTRYCDAHRLPVEARLRLFAAVCEAVHFAHRNFVVHRDIKPSNILVTEDGTPRLLDFGIARLLDPAAPDGRRDTRPELRMLTPEYAAPEQLRGAAVTTASDVYALGVVLHQLMTGRRPRSGAAERASDVVSRVPREGDGDEAPDEAARLRDTTPKRLQRRLRGDLDTVIARALAEQPARRYSSAEALRADVQRHLDGLPVAARGDSVAYRAGKFVRRHRVGVAAASLVALSLVGGMGAALWQGERAARERDVARTERARAEEVSGFLLGLFEAADPMGDGSADTLRVRHLVDRGAERVRTELAGQPDLQAQMLVTLARVYANLGLPASARELLDDGLAVEDPSPAGTRRRAELIAVLAQVQTDLGEYGAADSLYRRVLQAYEARRWEPDLVFLSSLTEHGSVLAKLGRNDEAEALHLRALRHLDEASEGRTKTRGAAVNNLGAHYAGLGDYARAEPLLREALAIDRSLFRADHPRLAVALNNVASAVHHQGRHDEAEPLYREAIAIARRNFGDSHPTVGQFLENLATLHDDRRAYAQAEPLYREALRIYAQAVGPRAPQTAMLQRNLAINRIEAGDFAEAVTLLREAAATLHAALGSDHLYTVLARASLGQALAAAGQADEALPLLRDGLAGLEAQLPEDHWRIHHARSWLGAALAARGDSSAAGPLLRESYAALRSLKGNDAPATRAAREHLDRFHGARDET